MNKGDTPIQNDETQINCSYLITVNYQVKTIFFFSLQWRRRSTSVHVNKEGRETPFRVLGQCR